METKQKNYISPLRRLWRIAASEKQRIIQIILFATLAGIISLALPLGMQAIVTYVSLGQTTTSWAVLVMLVVLAIAAYGLMNLLQLVITEKIQQGIFARSAFEFAYRVPRIRMSAMYGQYAPELMNRFFDTISLQKGMAKILLDLPSSALQILISLLLLSLYHPFFIIFGLVFLFSVYLVLRLTGPSGLRTSLMESKYKYKAAHWLEEIAQKLEPFKIHGSSDYAMQRTDDLVINYLQYRKAHFRILLTKHITVTLIKVMTIASLLIIGGMLVMQGQMNLGQFVATEIVLLVLMTSVEKLILSAETVYDVLTSLEKIGSVTDLPLDNRGGVVLPPANRDKGLHIEAKNLSWNHQDEALQAVEQVNLEIKSGQMILLTGKEDGRRSGLLRLLAGLYDDYEGSLSADNIPYKNLDTSSLHAVTGSTFSLQELLYGTLSENISMGRKEVTFDEIVKAARITGLNELAEMHPQGYDMLIIPDPGKIPLSLARRILLARAMAGNPRFIALSNPFTGLPPEMIASIVKSLKTTGDTCTVVISSDNVPDESIFDQVIRFDSKTNKNN